jgi:hypothetical protein
MKLVRWMAMGKSGRKGRKLLRRPPLWLGRREVGSCVGDARLAASVDEVISDAKGRQQVGVGAAQVGVMGADRVGPSEVE